MDGGERLAWLRERQSGLGGTDMASICGVGFSDAAGVYAEKVAPEPVDRQPSGLMLLGLATEDLNARLYAQKTGARLLSPGLVRAASEPWAFATFDRIRPDDHRGDPTNFGCPVELKYVGPFFGDQWGPDGSDEVRDGYTVQATWEAQILRMGGHDVRRTDVSALAGSGDHRIYPVPFDAQLGGMLLEIGREFWGRVVSRTGVEGWRPPLVEEVERRLVEIKPETRVPLGLEAVAIVAEIDALTEIKRGGEAAEERIKLLKRQLSELLGPAAVGELPDGRSVKQSLIPAKLIAPEPYLREARVDVRILKAPKGKVRS